MAKPEFDIKPIFLKCPNPPDIVVFGFQELDMSAESILKHQTSRAQPWIDHIEKELNLTAEYRNDKNADLPDEETYALIQAKQLCGVLLTIYSKKKHLPFISDIQTVVRVTGILGMMGNKGGIATRFQLYDSTFCFINAHFNAHQTNVSRRNQDYRDICSIIFTLQNGSKINIFEHDNLFWMGDLNYRIDLPYEMVKEKIEKSQWIHLSYADQLNIQMKMGNVFNGWFESPIRFAPTYKYTVGTNEYDEEKLRIPAWCDRILWKRNSYIKSIYYDRHEILQSDHRPVSNLFSVATKTIILDKRTKVLQSILQEIDKIQNDLKPDAMLSSTECDFEEVMFEIPKTKTIYLENTGKVSCDWSLIPKLDESTPHKDWISVIPISGTLMPKETTPISITININKGNIYSIDMTDDNPLRDILVLQIKGGKSYFITVSGDFKKYFLEDDDD